MKGKNTKSGTARSKKKTEKSPYQSIATHMVEFLIERKVIRLTDEFQQDAPVVRGLY